MICQECQEEYQFERVRLDPESCRSFVSFSCDCKAKLVLPEDDCLRLGLLGNEAREQLRHLRMVSFRKRLDNEKKPGKVYLKAMKAHQRILLQYLEEVSRKEINFS